MDEHKPQEQASEKVPARRKSGRMHGWRASILACVICILVTALVTSMIFVGKFGGSSNYKLALKFAQVKQVELIVDGRGIQGLSDVLQQ